MKFGLMDFSSGLCASDPDAAVRLAIAAEEVGFESVWAGEHYILPDPQRWPTDSSWPGGGTRVRYAGHIVEPSHPFLDPFVALANIAAHTTTLRLGIGVAVVPLHQPAMLAKRTASLARISHDRLILGVGAGYLEPEFAAFGVALERRGARTDEALDAMISIWSGDIVDHYGEFFAIEGMRSAPVPGVPIPLVIGGESDAALIRAVRFGAGWYGWSMTPDRVAPFAARLECAARAAGRGPRTEVTVTPPPGTTLSPELVAAYQAVGVDRVVVPPPLDVWTGEESGYLDFLRTALPRR